MSLEPASTDSKIYKWFSELRGTIALFLLYLSIYYTLSLVNASGARLWERPQCVKGCCCKDIMMIMVQSQGLITPFSTGWENMMPQSSILFGQGGLCVAIELLFGICSFLSVGKDSFYMSSVQVELLIMLFYNTHYVL